MTKTEVIKVLERALNERPFWEQLTKNFDKAVKGYDLSAEEKAVLKNSDEGALRAMGLDERLNKPIGYWR